ncbi:hypothetical protein JCM17823_09690 [Halorubrum gandharaense]
MSADTNHTYAAESSTTTATEGAEDSTEAAVRSDPAKPAAAAATFDRVLVVTDGEATGRAAVDAGIGLAAAHDADVDALFVVDTTEHWDMAVERRERAGEAAVEEAAARGEAAGVDVHKRFRYGSTHEAVLEHADAHDVDLIVVGSARRTGLDRLVNPETVPVRVQRGADVPVLVVGADDA